MTKSGLLETNMLLKHSVNTSKMRMGTMVKLGMYELTMM